jgi:hypothetical protein
MIQIDSKIDEYIDLFNKEIEKIWEREIIKRLAKVIIKLITKEKPPWKYRCIGPYNKNDLTIYINHIIERSGNSKPEIKLFYNQNNINDENYSASILFCDINNIKSFAYKTVQSQKFKLDNIMKLAGDLYKENNIIKGDIDNVKKLYENVHNLINNTIEIVSIYYKIESEENEIKIENALVESSKALNGLISYMNQLLMNISQRNKNNKNV